MVDKDLSNWSRATVALAGTFIPAVPDRDGGQNGSNDTIDDGTGTDLFVWTAASRDGEADTITDFETGAGASAADLDPYLDFSFAGGNTIITIDFDGGGA